MTAGQVVNEGRSVTGRVLRKRVRVSLARWGDSVDAVAAALRVLVDRGAIEAGEPGDLAEAQPQEPWR